MKKIKLITPLPHYDKDAPLIVPASKKVPDWFKRIPPFLNGAKSLEMDKNTFHLNTTVKWCNPFLDAFTTGYMLVLDADVEVYRAADGEPMVTWRSSTIQGLINTQDEDSVSMVPKSNIYYEKVFKFEGVAIAETPSGYSTLFTRPLNRLDLPFTIFDGIVDTDSYPKAVNLPFVINKNFIGIIPAGTPIAQLIPIKREEWESEYSTISYEETILRKVKVMKHMYRTYKNNFWSKKTYR